jgi:two-component system sensor histidine kinase MtrB
VDQHTGLLGYWRRSIQFRTVALTVLVTIAVVGVSGGVLIQRVVDELENARVRSAMAEAAAGRSIARAAAQGTSAADTPEQVADSLVEELSRRAGKPPAFEVVLVPEPGSGNPGASTNLIDAETVPPELAAEVVAKGNQLWLYAPIDYSDSRVQDGIIVGAPVIIRGIGKYQLYYMFSLESVQRTASIVTSAIVAVGIVLVFTLGMLAYFATRGVVRPVQQVSKAADALAAGELDSRLAVRGEDDLAKLATAFNTMAQSLTDKIEALEVLSDAQRRFVSDVSHELRTPLTTIRMASDVATASIDPSATDAQRAAALLSREVDRFDALLSDLLEVSRFDAGAASLEMEVTDLGVLLEEIVGQLGPVSRERDTPLETVLPASPCLAQCDPRRVKRVVRNLLINALEYGEGQPISLSLECDSTKVRIGVRDQGIGIPQDAQGRVFERFWRADASRARTLGGTGLGLAISREDARLHGGDLTLTSANPGCEFMFLLPIGDTCGVV